MLERCGSCFIWQYSCVGSLLCKIEEVQVSLLKKKQQDAIETRICQRQIHKRAEVIKYATRSYKAIRRVIDETLQCPSCSF